MTVYSQGTWIDCFCYSSVLTPNYALTWPSGRAVRMGRQDGPSGLAVRIGRQDGPSGWPSGRVGSQMSCQIGCRE